MGSSSTEPKCKQIYLVMAILIKGHTQLRKGHHKLVEEAELRRKSWQVFHVQLFNYYQPSAAEEGLHQR